MTALPRESATMTASIAELTAALRRVGDVAACLMEVRADSKEVTASCLTVRVFVLVAVGLSTLADRLRAGLSGSATAPCIAAELACGIERVCELAAAVVSRAEVSCSNQRRLDCLSRCRRLSANIVPCFALITPQQPAEPALHSIDLI